MAVFKRFEDIQAWQLARELFKVVYRVTSKGEFAKDFGFRDQMRNAAGSSMDNIAEGYERDGTKEFINFVSISKAQLGKFVPKLIELWMLVMSHMKSFKRYLALQRG